MDKKQALEKLNLPPEATNKDIKNKFFELYVQAKEKDDHEQMISLIEAYQTSLSKVNSNYLIPMELTKQITVFRKELEQNKATEKVLKIIIKRTKRRLRKIVAYSGLASFCGTILSFLIPRLTGFIDPLGYVAITLISIGVICFFIAFIYTVRERNIGDTIEDISYTLDNRNIVKELYKDITLEAYGEKGFMKYQLILKIEKWYIRKKSWVDNEKEKHLLEKLIKIIGYENFAELLLRKGIEHGYMIEHHHKQSGKYEYLFYNLFN